MLPARSRVNRLVAKTPAARVFDLHLCLLVMVLLNFLQGFSRSGGQRILRSIVRDRLFEVTHESILISSTLVIEETIDGRGARRTEDAISVFVTLFSTDAPTK